MFLRRNSVSQGSKDHLNSKGAALQSRRERSALAWVPASVHLFIARLPWFCEQPVRTEMPLPLGRE